MPDAASHSSAATTLPVWRALLTLGLPSLATQALHFIIHQYDQYLASSMSADHQAALTVANYIYWFLSSYSVIVSSGATALIGRLVGAKDFPTANHAVGQVMLLAICFGSFAMFMGFLGLPELMQTLKLQGPAPQYAVEFLYPLAGILVLQMIETAGISSLVGAGDTRTGLFILVLVTVVNVPAAWLFRNEYGFVGIAYGTAIAHALGGLTVIALLLRGRSGLKLSLGKLLPNGGLLYRLLRVSVPAAMDSLSVACCQLWFLSIVNKLGNEASAAHGIAIRLEALGYLAGGAFGPAAMAIVSQSLGAKQPERAARGGWSAYLFGACLMSLMGVIFYVFAESMCRIHNSNNQRVVQLAAEALRLIAFAMPGLAAWSIISPSLRAAGDTRVPLLFSWFGFLGVRIPLAYWLTQDYGLLGAWWAMTADIYVRATLLLWRFGSGKWKKIQV